MNHHIPAFLTRYFWGDNIDELDLKKHTKYIVQTLLENGDSHALKWLFSVLDKSSIKLLLPELRLSKKSANFWHIYLSI
jgi:hypothetical protein